MERLKPASIPSQFFRLSFLPEGLLNQRRLVLKKILVQYMGLSLTREQPSLQLKDIEYAGMLPELKKIARQLGMEAALPEEVDLVETEVNGIAIALDEEMHFNEYRLLTLHSSIYAEPLICQLKRYRAYCHQKDKRGQANRNRVPNIVKEKPLQQSILALNDFMQDMLPLVHYVPLLRLSVYDSISSPSGNRSLASLLEQDHQKDYPLVARFLEEKLTQLESSFHLDY